MNKKRKGFSLLITLLFVIFAIGIFYYILKEVKDFKKDTTFYKKYYQAKIFAKDIILELKKYKNNINENNIYKLYRAVPIYFKNEKYLIKIMPYYQAIDINNIKKGNIVYDIIYKELVKNNVESPSYFLDIVLDTIDKDSTERNYKTEIYLYDINFKQGRINDKNKMMKICNYYYLLTGDPNIFKINWDNIISYFNIKNSLNYLYLIIYFDGDENYLKILFNWKTSKIKEKIMNIVY